MVHASLVPEYLGEGVTAELAVRCAPGRLHDTALALARRPDTRSVEVGTGPAELTAEVMAASPEQLLDVIDGSIGQLEGIVGIHSSVVLRLLLTASDWAPYDDEPTHTRRLLAEGRPLPSRSRSTPSTASWSGCSRTTREYPPAAWPASSASARPPPAADWPG